MHILDCHTYNFRVWVIQANRLDQDLEGENCIYQLLATAFVSITNYIYFAMRNLDI